MINTKKATIIYNYYELFKKYFDEKEKNIKLKFTTSEKRYNEKVHICYNFIRDLLEKVKDINCKEINKKHDIIDILSKCRISITKLYRIRENEYTNLLDFIEPFYVKRCKEYRIQNKIIYCCVFIF